MIQPRKKDDNGRLLWLTLLPGLHLFLCVCTDMLIGEDGFKWFIVAFIDFPVFIGLAALRLDLTPFLEYSVIGTLWWFLIGALFRFLYEKMVLSSD